jgi:hypothetical protein
VLPPEALPAEPPEALPPLPFDPPVPVSCPVPASVPEPVLSLLHATGTASSAPSAAADEIRITFRFIAILFKVTSTASLLGAKFAKQ